MFSELAKKRRSIKKFTSQEVEQEKIDAIIEAALRSPSGRAARPWEFVVVKDESLHEKLSVAKPKGAEFIKGAFAGIVICADPSKSNLWIEDCTIAAVSMQYAAHSMGLGSRWCQIRGTNFNDSKSSRDYLAELLDLPDEGLDVLIVEAVRHAGNVESPEVDEHRLDLFVYAAQSARGDIPVVVAELEDGDLFFLRNFLGRCRKQNA